jgi:hypothetical protein
MEDAPVPSGRRHLLDGLFALSLYGLAILIGYAVLKADRPRPTQAALLPPGVRPPAIKPVEPGAVAPTRQSADFLPDVVPAPERATTPAEAPAVEPPKAGEPSKGEVPKVRAPRVEPAKAEAEKPQDTRPWPSPVKGRVLDEKREPVAGAFVVADGMEIPTEADGSFKRDKLAPGSRLIVKMPGYARQVFEPTPDPIEAVLKPQVIRAAYLTYFGVAHAGIRGRVLDLVNRTELNAVVIDVKGDRGWILYPTEVPMALAAGAQGPATMRNFNDLMAELKARGVYTIARIVAFKDNVLATHRPDLAIIDTRTGRPWTDRENLAWVDPFREEVWAYNIAIAKEAVKRGFDEIQFDYVRFPTDGRLAAARYSKPVNKDTRLPTIAAFLAHARREIGPTGAFLAADIFGYTAFNDNDTDIGQRIEELAPHLDFICPMVYPSGYHLGIPGYRNPVQHPYEVVHESVKLIRKRANNGVVRVRPWLQDFKDYAFDRRVFGVAQIQAQVRGADQAGALGWMLWNPRNDYTGAALRPKGGLAETGSTRKSLTD